MQDLADPAALPWLALAPIVYVEDGWSTIVVSLLAEVDAILAEHPASGVDVLDVSEPGARLRGVYELTGAFDEALGSAIAAVVADAVATSAVTCARCGRPGVARRHPSWPLIHCDAHATW